MKILHLITSLEGGGTENFLYQILANSPAGYDHQVVYLKKDGVIGERLRRKQIPVRPAGSLIKLLRDLRRDRPEILHTCLYSAHILGRILGNISQGPRIVTSQRAIDIWQQPWQTVLDRWTLPLSDAVLVNSHAAAELIEKRRGARSRPEIFEVPNAVDLSRFQPSGTGGRTATRSLYNLPTDAIVGGALMRLHAEKGADFIPAYVDELLPKNPKLHLLIGGVGPFETSLKQRLEKTDYADRVHWMGWEDDTPRFLSACDFFWSLSREESFPQTLVEASLMGLPWVAPNVGGVPELARSGAIGLMFPRLEIDQATQQTTQLMNDLPRYTSQAQQAVPALQQKYSLEKMVTKVYDVFNRYR